MRDYIPGEIVKIVKGTSVTLEYSGGKRMTVLSSFLPEDVQVGNKITLIFEVKLLKVEVDDPR